MAKPWRERWLDFLCRVLHHKWCFSHRHDGRDIKWCKRCGQLS